MPESPRWIRFLACFAVVLVAPVLFLLALAAGLGDCVLLFIMFLRDARERIGDRLENLRGS